MSQFPAVMEKECNMDLQEGSCDATSFALPGIVSIAV
jgi:hypothetical protein